MRVELAEAEGGTLVTLSACYILLQFSSSTGG